MSVNELMSKIRTMFDELYKINPEKACKLAEELKETYERQRKQDSCEEHDFQFVPCFGTFCKKCDVGYGVHCLKDSCGKRDCTLHNLDYEPFCGKTYGDVVEDMTDEISYLCLGHDGVIEGEDEDVRKVLFFGGLETVQYCGYYTADNVTDIFEEEQYSHIKFVPQY